MRLNGQNLWKDPYMYNVFALMEECRTNIQSMVWEGLTGTGMCLFMWSRGREIAVANSQAYQKPQAPLNSIFILLSVSLALPLFRFLAGQVIDGLRVLMGTAEQESQGLSCHGNKPIGPSADPPECRGVVLRAYVCVRATNDPRSRWSSTRLLHFYLFIYAVWAIVLVKLTPATV